jgi:hypothetical protein
MREPVDPVLVYVQGFLDTFGTDCGQRLHEIVGTIGLTVKEVDAESFDGALVRIIGVPKGKIAINANIREPGRKRFTLAHELGHYILPSHARQSVACRPNEIERWTPSMSQTELEANRFAAALLMPKPLIMEELRSEPSLEQARRISEHCQASLTAATYRLVELSSYPIAVVLSTMGRRAWFQRSKEFGRAVELGSVSPQSFAHDCFCGTSVPTRPEPVPATAWLYEDGLVENARIWEESKPMPFYDAVLTLLYLREPVDHRSDSDEILEELDPSEFTLERTRWPTK